MMKYRARKIRLSMVKKQIIETMVAAVVMAPFSNVYTINESITIPRVKDFVLLLLKINIMAQVISTSTAEESPRPTEKIQRYFDLKLSRLGSPNMRCEVPNAETRRRTARNMIGAHMNQFR